MTDKLLTDLFNSIVAGGRPPGPDAVVILADQVKGLPLTAKAQADPLMGIDVYVADSVVEGVNLYSHLVMLGKRVKPLGRLAAVLQPLIDATVTIHLADLVEPEPDAVVQAPALAGDHYGPSEMRKAYDVWSRLNPR